MTKRYVDIEDVKKLFYKMHEYHDFDNNTEVIKDGYMDKLNNLPTIELNDPKCNLDKLKAIDAEIDILNFNIQNCHISSMQDCLVYKLAALEKAKSILCSEKQGGLNDRCWF